MQFHSRYSAALGMVALMAMSPNALATQLAYEGFVPSFPVYANGVSGFNGPLDTGRLQCFCFRVYPKG